MRRIACGLALMGALVATLLCAYTLAKVLRDALFLANFGAFSLPYAYIGVALTSVAVVWIETRVARRVSRVTAMRFTQLVAIAASMAAAIVYPHAKRTTTALFYLWTGSQAMILLPQFWVLALDAWDSRRARRVFPVLSGFGLLGTSAIQWLLLEATPVGGSAGDLLAETTFIQRINTTGGLAPAATTCNADTADDIVEIPYTADYYFWKSTGG